MKNTTVEGNFLVIDDGVKKKYFNASWCSLEFTDEAVIITDQGKLGVSGTSETILFTEFQFGGSAYATEALIFAQLNSVIG
ncbi:MAG: hypothetical protein HRT87_11995 [Legionellales bacterium]|nr:hypothetical protein [Legionellales bacterium]